MAMPDKHLFDFDLFRVDAQKRLLTRAGEVLPLTPKAFDTLLALVEKRGRVIEKDELMQSVWPDTIVEESALSRNIYLLRKALGESPDEHRFIVTVPGRGYRFVAEVTEAQAETVEFIVATKTRASIVTEEEDWGAEEVGDGGTGRLGDGEIRRLGDGETEGRNAQLPAIVAPSRRRVTALYFAGGLMLVVLAAGAVYWWGKSQSAISLSGGPQSAIKSIAVLPFKPLVAEGSDEYLQLGMADVLIMRLSNLRQLVIRPLGSVRRYAGLEQDPLAAGRELKVDAVLDGSIQRVGDRVRVNARLIGISDGATLWAEKFDEKFTDLLSVEDRLSEKLTGALALKLTGEEQRLLAKRYTENADAYQAYLRGRYFLYKWARPSLEKAIETFEQALAADPDYAPAHSGVADAWNLLGYLGFLPPREAFPKSEAAAKRALQLDDSLGEAHLSLAKTKLFYDWDWDECEREIKRALELAPNFADTHGMNGAYLTAMGRFDEALAARKRALEIDPTSPLFTTMVGWVYFYQRRYDQAVEWYRRALELDPNFAQPQDDIALALYMKNGDAQSFREIFKAKTLSGTSAEKIAALRQAYSSGGKTGYWRKELELALEEQGRVGAWRMARIYAELGDKDQAIAQLNKACEERVSLLSFLKVTPIFDSLHSDQRFANLLMRVGLMQ
ncbi:MAG: tetratricopeptide repeat protein [Acidobacteriota bacterium]